MGVIVGTAGHIDHGKTALVKALTGTDADRLPEEKQRGITIDLGFAELDLGDVRIGFVDVPGHERFVKNMLAGASGIDLVLFVIAADEGVMPQTREHFDICRLLDTKAGVIVLTKKDSVDDEMLDLVKIETAELVEDSFLENAPVVAVSARTGEGIEELKAALLDAAKKIPQRKNELIARLPIDRSFTVKGFGAVITGTLLSGGVSEGEELELLPAGKKVRIRGIQTHGRSVATAHAGQRTAINLGGIDHSEIERGMILSEREILRPTQVIDARVEVVKDAVRPIRSRQRVRVHIGTVEALARIQVLNENGEIAPGNVEFAQLRLEQAVAIIHGEKFIVRSYSPQMTIAGGTVLDAQPRKHRRKEIANVREYLQDLIKARNNKPEIVKLKINASGESGMTFADLQALTGWRREILNSVLAENIVSGSLISAESVYIAKDFFDELQSNTLKEISKHHEREPLSKGIQRETLREKLFANLPVDIFKAVLENLENDGKTASTKDSVSLATHSRLLSSEEQIIQTNLRNIYTVAKLDVPKLDEAIADSIKNTKLRTDQARKVFQLLIDGGEIVKISDEFFFSKPVIDELKEKLSEFATATSDRLIDVPKFKDIAGVSRKYAIPLLEYFDRERITRRAGDKRLVL